MIFLSKKFRFTLYAIFFMLFSAASFISCASLPEPSEKNDCLVYGNVDFYFTTNPDKIGPTEKNVVKKVITVKFKNVKTKKIITLRSNSKGEIMKTGIPQGTYIISSIKREISYTSGWNSWYLVEFDKNKTFYYFIPTENTVINLGVIVLEITPKGSDFWWQVKWDKDYEKARDVFRHEHPDSEWHRKTWLTPRESLEKHLTLFP